MKKSVWVLLSAFAVVGLGVGFWQLSNSTTTESDDAFVFQAQATGGNYCSLGITVTNPIAPGAATVQYSPWPLQPGYSTYCYRTYNGTYAGSFYLNTNGVANLTNLGAGNHSITCSLSYGSSVLAECSGLFSIQSGSTGTGSTGTGSTGTGSTGTGSTGTGSTGQFIDLSLTKTFIVQTGVYMTGSSGEIYQTTLIFFTLAVTNNGNTAATNFTVKDYLGMGNMTFYYASDGGVHNKGIITWSITNLNPGKTKYLTLMVIRKSENIITLNKAEVCNYEELGEPQDPDSNPCTMGPWGLPKQDDEAQAKVPPVPFKIG